MEDEAKSVESMIKGGMRMLLIREGKREKRKLSPYRAFRVVGRSPTVLKGKGGMKKRYGKDMSHAKKAL